MEHQTDLKGYSKELDRLIEELRKLQEELWLEIRIK